MEFLEEKPRKEAWEVFPAREAVGQEEVEGVRKCEAGRTGIDVRADAGKGDDVGPGVGHTEGVPFSCFPSD
jgi:hypothetical protein